MLPKEMVMRVNKMITNSLGKCMKICMENLYVDIGA